MQVIEPGTLCTDIDWEVDSSGQLPAPFMSFMANGNLVPVSFKQEVLQAENLVRQQQEQQRQVFTGAGGMITILPWGDIQVPVAALFFMLQVRRDQLLHDTFVALQEAAENSPEDLWRPLKVKFDDEEGVDEGGVAKEYFRLLFQQLFSPEYGMYKTDPESRYLWFDPGSLNDRADFWMVGAVIGLAVYNNIPGLDVNFPPALFNKIKDQPLTMEDFGRVFPAHATSIQAVLDWPIPTDLSEAEADQLFQDTFCLDFSVSYDFFGATRTDNLLPDEVTPSPVSLSRRGEFAEAYKEWFLTTGVKTPFEEFHRGFNQVCSSPVFKCLSAAELEAIVCGEKDLNFEHLQKGAQIIESEIPYQDGYLDDFWDILLSSDEMRKRQFLNFVTSSDLAPVGGLERLELKIQRNGGEPTNQLPTSHTCFNLLMLPEYESKEKLRKLLLLAIENAEGFGLQ